MKKTFLVTLLISFFFLFSPISHSAETCNPAIDCTESINENTYSLVDNIEDVTERYEKTMLIFGVFAGLSLFSSGFLVSKVLSK